MKPTPIRQPPSLEDYVPIDEHQSQTPELFFNGKPVLHHLSRGARAQIPREQCGTLSFFGADAAGGDTKDDDKEDKAEAEDDDEEEDEADNQPWDMVEREVDIVVNSQNLIIYCPEMESGIEIPYRSIAMHGIQSSGEGENKKRVVWLQLELWDPEDEDCGDPVDMTLLPASSSSAPDRVQELYKALTDCADLHPDSGDEDEDEDGFDRIIFEGGGSRVDGIPGAWSLADDDGGEALGLPPPMPGSSGWITADNVDQFFDDKGNWIAGEEGEAGEEVENEGIAVPSGELGEGAGHVRSREETERDEKANEEAAGSKEAQTNGNGESAEKKARTE